MAKNQPSRDMVGFGDKLPEDYSFQELLEAGVIDIAEIDDRLQVDQQDLVGVSFILVSYEIKESNKVMRDGKPTSYAFCEVRTGPDAPSDFRNALCVFADGGAGIMDQLERYKGKMNSSGITDVRIYFHYGLRVSEYEYTDEKGDKSPARTYYFDNRRRP